eukprot:scaffold546_cov163-Amphora_coffeaeformis.AAC.7
MMTFKESSSRPCGREIFQVYPTIWYDSKYKRSWNDNYYTTPYSTINRNVMNNLLGRRNALLWMATILFGVLNNDGAMGFQAVEVAVGMPTPTQSRYGYNSNARSCSSSSSNTSLYAKKKKNKPKKTAKQQQQQQQSGFAWATSFTLKPYEAQSTRELVTTAVASFQGRTGKVLCEELVGATDIPKALWKAPVACIVVVEPSENENNDSSPPPTTTTIATGGQIKYANVAALESVGLTEQEWDRLVVNPSKRPPTGDDASSLPPAPTISLSLPANMKEKTYESGYQKKILRKQSSSLSMLDDTADNNRSDNNDDEGHDVVILDAHRWKLEKSALVDGAFVTTSLGVAYAWKEWVVDDTTLCTAGGQRRPWVPLPELERAVQDQATLIRNMKERQGLTNKDTQVQEAVAELLRLKEMEKCLEEYGKLRVGEILIFGASRLSVVITKQEKKMIISKRDDYVSPHSSPIRSSAAVNVTCRQQARLEGGKPGAYAPCMLPGRRQARLEGGKPGVRHPDPKFGHRDPKFGHPDPKFGHRDPKFGHADPKFGHPSKIQTPRPNLRRTPTTIQCLYRVTSPFLFLDDDIVPLFVIIIIIVTNHVVNNSLLLQIMLSTIAKTEEASHKCKR